MRAQTRRLWLPVIFMSPTPVTMNPSMAGNFRRLHRAALKAVRYSHPAKYQIRDAMRSAFRSEPAHPVDQQSITNTLEFLQRAESHAGIEHKILRNLLHVRYWQNHAKKDNKLSVNNKLISIRILIGAESISRPTWLRRFERTPGLILMPP